MKLTNAQIYTLRRLSGGVNINSVVTEKGAGMQAEDQGYSPMIFLHHLFLSCFVSGWWTMYIRGGENTPCFMRSRLPTRGNKPLPP